MRKSLAFVALVALACAGLAVAQVAPPSGQKTLAATMSIYAFPANGQDASQQSKDESECYNWAVTNTGTDPFALQKQAEAEKQQAAQAQQQAAQAGKGAGAGGAVKGAAAGALIGEIASDDAGKGAAYGAAAGVVAGRRRGKQAEEKASSQAEAQSQQAAQSTAQQMDGFKKAFSACLETKKYTVKY